MAEKSRLVVDHLPQHTAGNGGFKEVLKVMREPGVWEVLKNQQVSKRDFISGVRRQNGKVSRMTASANSKKTPDSKEAAGVG